MVKFHLPSRRLLNQRIARSSFAEPAEAVAWLGAVQSQDFAAARWALGLRVPGSRDASIERAFNDGTILRTHVMRPTWHFVTPADIRWLLALTAPRVHASNATYYRRLGLDAPTFRRSHAVLEKSLQGGRQLTRTELADLLQQAGIATDGLRLAYLILHAELEGVVCSGARRGRQFTYALLEERVHRGRSLDHDEALAELALRYFSSHGPAGLRDFVWWSGLATPEARRGLEMLGSRLVRENMDGISYWSAESGPAPKPASPRTFLLPCFDEYIVGYTDRRAISDRVQLDRLDARGNPLFNNVIVRDGQVAGTWKRTLRKGAVEIELKTFDPPDVAERQSLGGAADRYGAFHGLPVTLKYG